MYSLFSTSSDKAGYRLQYMEVYNWGTFDGEIFKISPKGNNSLLTGANASGKSTFIDALLTLLVPVKGDRFYNQSSGVEKKGDRTEETYVYGHYGNIQNEGELKATTQKLRDHTAYSVLLASFENTEGQVITLFQVRWFSNGELKRSFGIAHVPLEIEKDFGQFDGKGIWKRRLEKIYNYAVSKKRVEFLDGPTKYAERLAYLFGMRSVNALSLFNQVVGVKVLEDLDEFIRMNMLEYQDAEAEFIQLKESFITLMDAKTNIEKAKEQIAQLTPINDLATQLAEIEAKLEVLQKDKDTAVFWFAGKGVELITAKLDKNKEVLQQLKADLIQLKEKDEAARKQERALSMSIENEEVWKQIEKIEEEIKQAEKLRNHRQHKLESYNRLVAALDLPQNPDANVFADSRALTQEKRSEGDVQRELEEEKKRQIKNEIDRLQEEVDNLLAVVGSLQKNKNNISGREADIREDILAHVGATKDELPFIGELIRVREEDLEWEPAIEKVLHNFALRLIVPEKYYNEVNAYVNRTNLKGRITYQRYKGFTSMGSLKRRSYEGDLLVNKLEFKDGSVYAEWLEDAIAGQYNYSCAESLEEFNRYEEKALTKEGLINAVKGKHEKDDRPHIARRENFVLGWDNKDKINLLKQELSVFQEKQKENQQQLEFINQSIKKIDELKEKFYQLYSDYAVFEDLNWAVYATEIEEKKTVKESLEKTNDKVRELQKQLEIVKGQLDAIDKEKERSVKLKHDTEWMKQSLEKELTANKETLALFEGHHPEVAEFEASHEHLLNIQHVNFKVAQDSFREQNMNLGNDLRSEKHKKENAARIKINNFKQPNEQLTQKFKDWRSDVNGLPDSTNLEFIAEYQKRLQQLKEDNLPKYEQKFEAYLQETIINKIGDFRMFFENWAESIKENVKVLNEALFEIDFKSTPKTYIQLVAPDRIYEDVKTFRTLLNNAIPNGQEGEDLIEGKKLHFDRHIEPLIEKLEKEEWRKKVMDVRSWYSYKAEEFYKETGQKYKTYENMGQLSGGEKAQLTYTILGSAIAYQFGLTKEGLQNNSFRFIAIDEAFKAQDEDKARYLITLCRQLHLQLLVVTPSDNIHIVENDISFVHFVERKDERHSWLYDMPIEQFKAERAHFVKD